MMYTELKNGMVIENLEQLMMILDHLEDLTLSLEEVELHINDLVHLSHNHGLELIEEVPNKVYEIYDAKKDKRIRFEIDEETGNVSKYEAGASPTPH